MPALVAFGRRWQVGGDDFVAPGFIDLAVKFCWLVAAVTIYLRNDANLEVCNSGKHLRIYMYGIFANLILIIFVDLVALKTTMTGYIMDTKSRRFLTPCIYIRLICEAVDVCWNLLGTIWVYGHSLNCKEAPEALAFVKRFIICNWLSLVVLTLFMLFLFDRFGGKDNWTLGHLDPFSLSTTTTTSTENNNDYYVKHEAFWTAKWRKLTCSCTSGGEDQETINEGFQEIGKIFSTLLKEHDFVTTDVVAGFLCLYQREQDKKKQEAEPTELKNSLTDNYKKLVQSLENENHHHHHNHHHHQYQNHHLHHHHPIVTRQPASLSRGSFILGQHLIGHHHQQQDVPSSLAASASAAAAAGGGGQVDEDGQSLSGDWIEDIVLVNHYLNFVLGSYGWPLFLSNNYKNRAVRRLWKHLRCCGCVRSQEFKLVGDNCCLCHASALRETTQLSPKDFIYVSFENNVYEPIFYVAVDHKTKSIVVSIRGTMSLVDLVADLTALPKTVDFIPGLPPNFKAYHGVILCAINIRKTLIEKKILEELKSQYPDYNLIFIGQSLGAGAATILGMMYLTQYPMLKVFAVAPLGGLLSLEASKFTESFTISIVYGDDLIPRLSLPSVDSLKNKIIQAILDSRTPKYQILLGGCACICGCGEENRPKIKFAESHHENGQNPQRHQPQKKQQQQHPHPVNNSKYPVAFGSKLEVPNNQAWRSRDTSGILTQFTYPMFLPGKILHITERPNYSDLQGGLRWHFRWADRTEFGEIIISPRMYKDHMHFRLEKALHEFVVAHRDSITLNLM